MTQLLRLLGAFRQTRRLSWPDRAALLAHQERQWQRYCRRVLPRSPWFRPWLEQPLDHWPQMNKALMMAHFDEMNTAGLKLAEVLACARAAEETRDFSPTLGRYSVGLSSGTSGGRGVFVVSPEERAQWAGVMLGRLLPGGLLQGQRVALFLRANSNLYRTVRTPCLQFRFFDLFSPLEAHAGPLAAMQPSIVVAPAQVLRALALRVQAGQLDIAPERVISVAEVLEPQDRRLLQQVFGRVSEVYQATEGFLGSSCSHGSLHLNESFLRIEPQWLDDKRFVPLVTDFTRSTQPIVRYRLDDILVARAAPCPCGNPELAIDRIEGRCDDVLRLPGAAGAPVTVFADVVSRALAQVLPLDADYRLVQSGPRALGLAIAPLDAAVHQRCRAHLGQVFARLGVATEALHWDAPAGLPVAVDFTVKRRRIVGWRAPA